MATSGDLGEYVRFTMGQATNDTIDRIQTDMSSSSITQACQTGMTTFLGDIKKGLPYTYQVLDSYGKPPPDILRGDTWWTGSYDGCILSSDALGGQDFSPLYCNSYANSTDITLSYCVPNVCSGEDVMGYNNLLVAALPMENMNSTRGWCQYKIPFGVADWVVTAIFVIMALLSVCGTVLHVIKKRRANGKRATHEDDNTRTENAEGTEPRSHSALLSFSWLKNGALLLDMTKKPGTITCIYGIRTIAMSWIVLGHSFDFAQGYIANKDYITTAIRSFTAQAIPSSVLAVDTFLVLSATLVSYISLKKIKQGKHHWGLFYFYRFWRLTPVYFFVILFSATLFAKLLDGPRMNDMADYGGKCMFYGVLNLLYLNNIWPPPSVGCIGWTWYLAMDTQYYLVSPLVFYFLYRKRWLGILFSAIGVAIPVISVLAVAFILGYYQVDPLKKSNDLAFYMIYFQPFSRSAPYVIGLILGYYLSEKKGKIKMKKVHVAIGWCVAFILAMSATYGFYYYNHTQTQSPLVASAINAAFYRIAFALAVAWVIAACQSGYGGPVNALLSWRVWIPLSRLTYCVYLLHPLVMFYTYTAARRRIYATTWTLTYYFIGHFVMSNLFAALACLLVEYPMDALGTVMFTCTCCKRKQTPPKEATDLPQNEAEGTTNGLVEEAEPTVEKISPEQTASV